MDTAAERAAMDVEVGPEGEGEGALALAGVPRGAWVGLGLVRYQAGPRLAGLAGLPPGLHLLHTGRGEGGAEGRHGRLLFLAPGALLPLRWDPNAEALGPEPAAGRHVADARAAGGARGLLAAGFGPFDHRRNARWAALVRHVCPGVLRRCLPREEAGGGRAPEGGSAEVVGAGLTSFTDFEGGSWVGPLLGAGAQRALRFTMAGLPPGSSGPEVTLWHTDGAARLGTLVRDRFDGDFMLLLGELQLSFAAFLQLSDLAAMEQWKTLTAAACGGEEWLCQQQSFLRELAFVVLEQLHVVDPDLFQDSVVGEGGFLGSALRGLAGALCTALSREAEGQVPMVGHTDVRRPAEELQALLGERFGVGLRCVPGERGPSRGLWSLDDTDGADSGEEGENAPTVVDLEPKPPLAQTPSIVEPACGAAGAGNGAPLERMKWMLE